MSDILKRHPVALTSAWNVEYFESKDHQKAGIVLRHNTLQAF